MILLRQELKTKITRYQSSRDSRNVDFIIGGNDKL